MSIEEIINLFETADVLKLVAIFFMFNISIIAIELMLDFGASKHRRWKDTGANIAIYFMGQITNKTFVGTLALMGLLPPYLLLPYEIPMTAWTWVLSVLAADFTYYWMHRTEHKHHILWGLHSAPFLEGL